MGSLVRASLYERVGTGCAPRAKQSGRGVASSISSSGNYASSGNWRQLLDGEGVRMRPFSMLVGGRREHVLVGRSPPARPAQHGVSLFAGAGSRNCWTAVACQCVRGGEYDRVRARGIQATIELEWWSTLRLVRQGNHRLVVALTMPSADSSTRRPPKFSRYIPSRSIHTAIDPSNYLLRAYRDETD
jgi:hypothetical protein